LKFEPDAEIGQISEAFERGRFAKVSGYRNLKGINPYQVYSKRPFPGFFLKGKIIIIGHRIEQGGEGAG
jgi:hypothetical protein